MVDHQLFTQASSFNNIQCTLLLLSLLLCDIKAETCFTSDGTRTRNPRLRRPMPYPLGHGGDTRN